MSATFEKINDAVKTAMKAKDKERLLALRSLVSEVQKVAKNALHDVVTEEDVLNALTKGVKQREDSIEQFKKANRTDLIEVEVFQLNVLKEFLPEQMSTEDVRAIVSETVERLANGAEKTKKLMGAVMKELNPILKGKADMKFVKQVIDELLN